MAVQAAGGAAVGRRALRLPPGRAAEQRGDADRSGAAQLDTIGEQTRALAQAAPYARSPADQRMLLAALQSRLARADAVVSASHRRVAGVAGQIRAVNFRIPFKPDPTTAATEPPRRKPEDHAKCIQKAAELNRKNKELTQEINDYNKKYPPGHVFDQRDPVAGQDQARTRLW